MIIRFKEIVILSKTEWLKSVKKFYSLEPIIKIQKQLIQ